jgi:hypothetical protein
VTTKIKKKTERKKKKKKIKRGQVAHIILAICWLIILVIVGPIIDPDPFLAFVVLFKNPSPFQPIVGFHFSP